MARNRSHDPVKLPSEAISPSAYASIVSGFSFKLKALERKYSGFVANCMKIIKEAQKFLDINISDHLNTSDHQSSKFIENLNMQKVKLKRDFINIEKMSFDLQSPENPQRQGKFLAHFQTAKEKILEKVDDHKSKYFIQTVLLNLEDKVQKELEVFENFGSYYAKLYEVEELLGKKTKEFEMLLENYNKLKETEMQVTSDKKYLPSPRNMSSGRTSPSGFFKSRDSEVQKLQTEIQYLKEKFVNLTGTAKKIVARKDGELQKLIEEKNNTLALSGLKFNETLNLFEEKVSNKLGVLVTAIRLIQGKANRFKVFRRISHVKDSEKDNLQSFVEQLKEELRIKENLLMKQKEKFTKLNKLYSDLHEKTKIFNVRYDGLMGEMNEKNEKNKIVEEKWEELRTENEKLKSYKVDLDREIAELKEYFQSDIDSLSDKIEKLFGENLCLKQKNDELKDKYEKVMVEKEKVLIQLFEKQEQEVSLRGDVKSQSALALKQELKISSLKIDSLTKENNYLKISQISLYENTFKEVLSLFYVLSKTLIDTFNRKIEKVFERLNRIAHKSKSIHQNKIPYSAPSDYSKQKISELTKACNKLGMENEILSKKCESYQNLITNLQQTCEKLTSQQDSLYKCPACESYSKIIKDKDERIFFLQKEVYLLGVENKKLKSEIQEIEFTFRDHGESKEFEAEKNKFSRQSRGLALYTEGVKATDSGNVSPTISDVDFTYTLEGTTIKSTHEIQTPLSVSNDEIKDLEFIE